MIDYQRFCGLEAESASGSGAEEESKETPQSEWDLSPARVSGMRRSGENILLLDVREPLEHEICHLGGRLIPLGSLEEEMDDLPRDRRIVVHCRSGVRSARAVRTLREVGFSDVWNLRGGILAWADQVDDTIPKY